MHFDLREFIIAVGYLGVLAIVFAESGLLIGFFLPGDSLLFTAGFLASSLNIFDIRALAIGCFIAAVVGDSVGYAFGHRVGRPLFNREDSLWFHKKHLERAQSFYEKHGGKTIVLARFLPVIRTFAPIVAGVGAMPYARFLAFNVIGGGLWALGLTTAGYFFGSLIPDPDRYLLPVIALIILISIAPTVLHVLRDEESRGVIALTVRRQLGRVRGRA